MKVPIFNGVFTNSRPDFEVSYPVNLVPVPGASDNPALLPLNNGYLKPHDGIAQLGVGPGVDRGGIERLGVHYRVMGEELVSVDGNGNYTRLGDIEGSDQVSFAYNTNLLATAAMGKLYYYNATGGSLFGIPSKRVFEVTDPNVGNVIDVVFLNGVFVVTDGKVVRSSSITNPTEFNPLAYESSEFDPDPVTGLIQFRSEIYVLNRHTIEVFAGVITGNDIYLPFLPISGAQIEKGCVGPQACCVFAETIAFLGGGHNEPISVYLGLNSRATKIATRSIEATLSAYTEAELSLAIVESRVYKNHEQLYIHLPDRTLVYDATASAAFQTPVWFQLTSSTIGFGQYKAQRFVYAHNKWFVGDPGSNSISIFDEFLSTQRGNVCRWQFDTSILYNKSRGAVVHELELVSLSGRNAFQTEPNIFTSYSDDGVVYSQRRSISAGKRGERNKRLVWRKNGHMRNFRVQRFEGDSNAHLVFARLEAQLEPLGY